MQKQNHDRTLVSFVLLNSCLNNGNFNFRPLLLVNNQQCHIGVARKINATEKKLAMHVPETPKAVNTPPPNPAVKKCKKEKEKQNTAVTAARLQTLRTALCQPTKRMVHITCTYKRNTTPRVLTRRRAFFVVYPAFFVLFVLQG